MCLCLRKCSNCGEYKDVENYYKNRNGLMAECRSCCLKKANNYKNNNREKVRESSKKSREKNKDKKNLANKKWENENKEKRKEYMRKYFQERRDNDPKYKMRMACHVRLHYALKRQGIKKTHKILDLIGCSVAYLKAHIEKQFENGMTWNNHGAYEGNGYTTWQVDHIIPCDKFDLSDPQKQKACFHYTNLQPLWAKDNLEKSAKYFMEVA